MSSKEQQYSNLYGPYAPGAHYLGDTIVYEAENAVIIWSYRNKSDELIYIADNQSGWPVEILARDLQEKEKFRKMSDIADLMPVHNLAMYLCCQHKGCMQESWQALLCYDHGLWFLKPLCSAHILESGHEPLPESRPVAPAAGKDEYDCPECGYAHHKSVKECPMLKLIDEGPGHE